MQSRRQGMDPHQGKLFQEKGALKGKMVLQLNSVTGLWVSLLPLPCAARGKLLPQL